MKLTDLINEIRLKPEEDIILTNIKKDIIGELLSAGTPDRIPEVDDATTILGIIDAVDWDDEVESRAFAYEMIIQSMLKTLGKSKLYGR